MITSATNPLIKNIKKLQDRRERQTSGLFFAEGIRLVGEAIQLGWEIDKLLHAPDLLRSTFGLELVREADQRKIPVINVSADVFKSVSCKDGPQGIAIIAKVKKFGLEKINQSSGLWVGIEAIQDSGNLGTILRTSDAVGAKGVILIDRCIDPFDPGVVRASMGAIFSQMVITISKDDFIQWAKKYQYQIIGTSDKSKMHYRAQKYNSDMILLLGSEQKGLSAELRNICHNMISIPMVGRSDSLNISIAAGVILYEIFEQISKAKPLGYKI